ncbi:nucleotidyltransferase domain-containing protein [Streptomyces sp. NPDC020875]|uniref:nucleotidyltransferase domain-containing protein n=1 Tax=Streptomyces sp. NPDC020875 TaxID=3154898 RepID=UPI0033C1BBCA
MTAEHAPGPGPAADPETERILARYAAELPEPVPLIALWVHGSIAEGTDYRPGRSDLDLIAVLERPCAPAEEERLAGLHRRLAGDEPLAARLHCSFMSATELADPGHDHLTWAFNELFRRPVSPVTRAELHRFGRVLYGRPVGGLLPGMTDRQLREYVHGQLRDELLPRCADEELFRQDTWVDYAMLALPRAAVTLADGRLITKAEAFGVLAELGAPAEVVADVRRRRYGAPGDGEDPGPGPEGDAPWLTRRARLTTDFLRSRAETLIAAYHPG